MDQIVKLPENDPMYENSKINRIRINWIKPGEDDKILTRIKEFVKSNGSEKTDIWFFNEKPSQKLQEDIETYLKDNVTVVRVCSGSTKYSSKMTDRNRLLQVIKEKLKFASSRDLNNTLKCTDYDRGYNLYNQWTTIRRNASNEFGNKDSKRDLTQVFNEFQSLIDFAQECNKATKDPQVLKAEKLKKISEFADFMQTNIAPIFNDLKNEPTNNTDDDNLISKNKNNSTNSIDDYKVESNKNENTINIPTNKKTNVLTKENETINIEDLEPKKITDNSTRNSDTLITNELAIIKKTNLNENLNNTINNTEGKILNSIVLNDSSITESFYTIDFEIERIEYNDGTRSSLDSEPHYRIFCDPEKNKTLAATLHDMGLSVSLASKNNSEFVAINENKLINKILSYGNLKNFLDALNTTLERTKNNPLPKLNVSRIETNKSGNNITQKTFSEFNKHKQYETILQELYNIGANLINTGKLYTPEPLNFENTNTDFAEKTKQAIATYNKLPTKRTNDGSFSNPYHAIFVISIALDHYPAEEILLLEEEISIASAQLTKGKGGEIIFPNNSRFPDAHAASPCLAAYILNNKKRFENLKGYDEDRYLPDNNTDLLQMCLLSPLGIETNFEDLIKHEINPFKPSLYLKENSSNLEIIDDSIGNSNLSTNKASEDKTAIQDINTNHISPIIIPNTNLNENPNQNDTDNIISYTDESYSENHTKLQHDVYYGKNETTNYRDDDNLISENKNNSTNSIDDYNEPPNQNDTNNLSLQEKIEPIENKNISKENEIIDIKVLEPEKIIVDSIDNSNSSTDNTNIVKTTIPEIKPISKIIIPKTNLNENPNNTDGNPMLENKINSTNSIDDYNEDQNHTGNIIYYPFESNEENHSIQQDYVYNEKNEPTNNTDDDNLISENNNKKTTELNPKVIINKLKDTLPGILEETISSMSWWGWYIIDYSNKHTLLTNAKTEIEKILKKDNPSTNDIRLLLYQFDNFKKGTQIIRTPLFFWNTAKDSEYTNSWKKLNELLKKKPSENETSVNETIEDVKKNSSFNNKN